MKYLSTRFDGTLHNPDMSLEGEDNDNDGIEVIPMEVKSNRTLLREKYEKAKANGQVISLTKATTTRSSIQSTFSSISATVTAMRATSRTEREVVIKSNSAMIRYEATRMVLSDLNGTKTFVIAPGETSNER
jgi:hypothetical protein